MKSFRVKPKDKICNYDSCMVVIHGDHQFSLSKNYSDHSFIWRKSIQRCSVKHLQCLFYGSSEHLKENQTYGNKI